MLGSTSSYLTEAFFLYKKNFRTYLPFLLLMFIVPVLQIFIKFGIDFLSFVSTIKAFVHGNISFATVFVPLLIQAFFFGIVFLFLLWIVIPLERTIFVTMHGNPRQKMSLMFKESQHYYVASLKTSILYAISVFWPFVITLILFILSLSLSSASGFLKPLFVLSYICAFAYAIYISVRYVFVILDIVLYDNPAKDVFKRVKQKTMGLWWHTFSILISGIIVVFILQFIINKIANGLASFLPSILGFIIILASYIIQFFIVQYIIILTVPLYRDIYNKQDISNKEA